MEVRFKVRSFDSPLSPEEYAKLPKNPVTVILDNLRSAFNVGSIFRTADATRIEQVIACGYTAHPPHLKLEKTALGTERFVKNGYFKNPVEAVQSIKSRNIPVIALETAENVKTYTEFAFPRPVCLVLGNEALGISREVLNEVDDAVQIPLFGFKNSLNVANAFSIVVYEVLRQWRSGADGK
jgi:23S rRNA (guanosine2251-2'-O)-methyltransferase